MEAFKINIKGQEFKLVTNASSLEIVRKAYEDAVKETGISFIYKSEGYIGHDDYFSDEVVEKLLTIGFPFNKYFDIDNFRKEKLEPEHYLIIWCWFICRQEPKLQFLIMDESNPNFYTTSGFNKLCQESENLFDMKSYYNYLYETHQNSRNQIVSTGTLSEGDTTSVITDTVGEAGTVLPNPTWTERPWTNERRDNVGRQIGRINSAWSLPTQSTNNVHLDTAAIISRTLELELEETELEDDGYESEDDEEEEDTEETPETPLLERPTGFFSGFLGIAGNRR